MLSSRSLSDSTVFWIVLHTKKYSSNKENSKYNIDLLFLLFN